MEGYAHAQPEVAHAQPEVVQNLPYWGLLPGSEGFPCFFLSTEGWGDLYDVRVIYFAWLLELAIRVLYFAWLPELALVINPFPAILFSYNIYIYVV